MFKYSLMILVMCICRLTIAHPLSIPENPTTASVLTHYSRLPYHLRQSAYEACNFFNQSVADHQDLKIINAEGQEFANLEDYKATLEPEVQANLTTLEGDSAFRDQPVWIYANPYMLFFWGTLSNHASLQKQRAEKLHKYLPSFGYERNKELKQVTESLIDCRADHRAQQFWQVIGAKVDLAVDHDNPYAQLIKGLCYVDGIGLVRDVNRGLHLIKRSANQHLLPALEFLTVYLKGAGQAYVDQGPDSVFNPKQLQGYEDFSKFLKNPFDELMKKIADLEEILEEIKGPLSVAEETELRVMLTLLPEGMLSGEELIRYQGDLQQGLKKLFGPQQHDFTFSKKDAYQLAVWCFIIFAHLVDRSDLEKALFYSVAVYSLILNAPVMALHFRHHFPYGFRERKRQYRLRQFDANQRESAVQLLSYRLLAASIKQQESIPARGDERATQRFTNELVRKVGTGLDQMKYEKDKTLYQLLEPTLSRVGLRERALPNTTVV